MPAPRRRQGPPHLATRLIPPKGPRQRPGVRSWPHYLTPCGRGSLSSAPIAWRLPLAPLLAPMGPMRASAPISLEVIEYFLSIGVRSGSRVGCETDSTSGITARPVPGKRLRRAQIRCPQNGANAGMDAL